MDSKRQRFLQNLCAFFSPSGTTPANPPTTRGLASKRKKEESPLQGARRGARAFFPSRALGKVQATQRKAITFPGPCLAPCNGGAW